MRCLKRFTFILLVSLFQNDAESKQIFLRKLEMCDSNYDYPMKLESSIGIQDGVHYINLTAIMNKPFGENQSMSIVLEYSRTGNVYIPMFKFSRSDTCDFLNKDLGPFWFDIQKQIAVPPRTCPLAIGRYNLRNYVLPYGKLNMPMPSGFIRGTIRIVEIKTNQMISCFHSLTEVGDDE